MTVRIQRTARARVRRAGPEGRDLTATVPEEPRVLEAAKAVLARIDAALR